MNLEHLMKGRLSDESKSFSDRETVKRLAESCGEAIANVTNFNELVFLN